MRDQPIKHHPGINPAPNINRKPQIPREIGDEFRKLAEKVGEEAAREHVLKFLKQLNAVSAPRPLHSKGKD